MDTDVDMDNGKTKKGKGNGGGEEWGEAHGGHGVENVDWELRTKKSSRVSSQSCQKRKLGFLKSTIVLRWSLRASSEKEKKPFRIKRVIEGKKGG